MDVIDYLKDHPNFFLFVVGFIALFIGSFLNVVIYRLPRMMEQHWSEECRLYLGLKQHSGEEKLSLYLPFSHCPRCKRMIRPWHNIPVISYLWLRGRCHFCKASISLRYPFVEGLTCVVSTYVAWRFGFSWQTMAALLFTWFSICLIFIDLDFHLLPDELTLTLLWIGLIFSLFNIFCDSHNAITGAVVGYLIFALVQHLFKLIMKKEGMGQGDFKYLAALGAYMGWHFLPLIILLASITGIIFAFTHMIIKWDFKSVPIPFGPYLAVAGWVALLWGDEIMRYYFSVLY